jgi:phage gp36-like protein
MGRYITQSDIENVFGAANVALWSNMDSATNRATVNAARVAAAIAYAEDYVDDRFRGGRYTIPFQASAGSLPKIIVDWCAKVAGVWLYESRGSSATNQDADGDRIRFHLRVVNELIDLYVGGERTLACERTERAGSAPWCRR